MKIYMPFLLKNLINDVSGNEIGKDVNLFLSNRLTDVFMTEWTYGLSLFRQAICNYEKNRGVSPANSKSEVPFFRENMNLLVGPEMSIYAARLYETYDACLMEHPDLILTLDYEKLGEHCIFENLFLLKCKYEEEQTVRFFEKQLETEYDKFFYDEEYTGFAPDSRFFSLLCNACLEIRESRFADQKEWILASLLRTDDAAYRYCNGRLESFATTSVPFDLIERISMPHYKERRDEYTALAGFLKQKGLNPEELLDGFE
jgi:hypothetical protein